MNEARKCEAPRCWVPTRCGKPYCPEHVGLNPYVSGLMSEIAEMAIEVDRTQANATGLMAEDLIRTLEGQNGGATARRLAQLMCVKPEVVEKLLVALEGRGRVTLGKTNRGRTVAKLVTKEAAA